MNARGEYGPFSGLSRIGDDVDKRASRDPSNPAYNPRLVFRDSVNELDAAIRQADHDFRAAPSEFRAVLLKNWSPFVRDWKHAQGQLLAGSKDRAATFVLKGWAEAFNDFVSSAGAGLGIGTTAPSVTIRGSVNESVYGDGYASTDGYGYRPY